MTELSRICFEVEPAVARGIKRLSDPLERLAALTAHFTRHAVTGQADHATPEEQHADDKGAAEVSAQPPLVADALPTQAAELRVNLQPDPGASREGQRWQDFAARDPQGAEEILQQVGRQLREWDHSAADDPDLETAVSNGYDSESNAWKTQPIGRQAVLIAHWIATGTFESLRGGGSSVEGEINNPIYIPKPYQFEAGDVLATGPGGAQIVVEDKTFYLGPNDTLYRTAQAARDAGGPGYEEFHSILEIIPGVMSNVEGERYADPETGMSAYRYVEDALASVDSSLPAGSRDAQPLSSVFPADQGWTLSTTASHGQVGPKPIGDPGGAHVHYNVGVPFAGLPGFLRLVEQKTWRDSSYGYHTRDHLTDALLFANVVTSRYMMWLATGHIFQQSMDLGHLIKAPLRDVQELRGYIALSYVIGATVVNAELDTQDRLTKVHAAILPRHHPGDLLRGLSPQARDYLRRDAKTIMRQFELSIRGRLRAESEKRPESIFKIVLAHSKMTLNDFFWSSLDESFPHQIKLSDAFSSTVLDDFDYLEPDPSFGRTEHIARVVLEVRSFGQRIVNQQQMIGWHDELTEFASYLHTAPMYSAEARTREFREQVLQRVRQHAAPAGSGPRSTHPDGDRARLPGAARGTVRDDTRDASGPLAGPSEQSKGALRAEEAHQFPADRMQPFEEEMAEQPAFLAEWVRDHGLSQQGVHEAILAASGLVVRSLGDLPVIGRGAADAKYRDAFRRIVAAVAVGRDEPAPISGKGKANGGPTPERDALLIRRLRDLNTAVGELVHARSEGAAGPETHHPRWVDDIASAVERDTIAAQELIPALAVADVEYLQIYRMARQDPLYAAELDRATQRSTTEKVGALLAAFSPGTRPAVRVWSGTADSRVETLTRILRTPGSRSLVLGAHSEGPVWALNLGGAIKWFSNDFQQVPQPQFTDEPVASIDIDNQGRLTGPAVHKAKEAQSADRTGVKTGFCDVSIGSDLSNVLPLHS